MPSATTSHTARTRVPGTFAALTDGEADALAAKLSSAITKFSAKGYLKSQVDTAAAFLDLQAEMAAQARARSRAVPYALTPKAIAYLDQAATPAADAPEATEWGCRQCGAAYCGSPPADGLCPSCADTEATR